MTPRSRSELRSAGLSGAKGKNRGHSGGHSKDEWFKVFENALTTLNMSEAEGQTLSLIALASPTPKHFVTVVRLIYKFEKAHADGHSIFPEILESVNGSPFSMTDWVDSIDFFNDWLVPQKRKTDLEPMLDYLRCCVAAPDAKESGTTLRALTEDMLKNFGYDAG